MKLPALPEIPRWLGRWAAISLALLIALAGVFIAGLYLGVHYPGQLSGLRQRWFPRPPRSIVPDSIRQAPRYNTLPPTAQQYAAAAAIRLPDTQAVRRKRTLLRQMMIDNRRQIAEIQFINARKIQPSANWRRLGAAVVYEHRLALPLDTVRCYELLPRANERPASALLYHLGHIGLSAHSRRFIKRTLASGRAVWLLQMPAIGWRDTLRYQDPELGPLRLTEPHELVAVHPRPYPYFFQPLAAAVNFVRRHYARYSLVGFSGGGWTVTLYAAMDPRVQHSVAIAGSLPLPLRRAGLSDAEQHDRRWLRHLSYPEAYVLASYGPGRTHTQVLNRYDGCCFYGPVGQAYVPAVHHAVQRLGAGRFRFRSDTTTYVHEISPATSRWLLGRLP
jgi:dienelactone hydrolase